ncbi:MAG: RNA ligase [Haloplanus sp.]
MSYHELLGLSRARFERLRPQFERRTHAGVEYRYLPDYRAGVERGTVLLAGTVVRGFPKIPRTLVVETGVPRQFEATDEVVVEEKLDGYNVRVAAVDGERYVFTRGGVVCPFTASKVESLLDLDAFFDDHPRALLCGEMVGPESPYTAHDYPGVDSLAFRAFDVRDRVTGDPVPVADRRDRCEEYGIPSVPLLGRYDPEDAASVRAVVCDLDAREREGIVLKSPDATTLLKYTTSWANRDDLAYAFSLPFDYGREFVFQRLVREAFQAVEFGDAETDVEARAHAVGSAILEPMVETVRRVDAGEWAGERHTVRGTPDEVAALFAHLRDMGLELDVRETTEAAGERVVSFEKRMPSTTDRTRAYLDGTLVTE